MADLAVVAAIAAGAAGLLVLLARSARSALTVCAATIADGVLTVTEGGLAPAVLSDLRDVVRRPPVARAHLRITRSRGKAVLEVRGAVPAHQLQQLRNVVGTVPLARLAAHGTRRTAPPRRR